MTITRSEFEYELRELETQPTLKEPGLFQVIMHNDDFTPMEFVVTVLELFFGMERVKAMSVMHEVHAHGRASCGAYSRDVAETKIDQVIEYARRHDHPLLCSVEAL
ncbi:ATP-dependent Clp protease adaptor ClpS [Gammaproteobacteria bacterium SCGC AG-212-F23]|nr:ATP-dependent Clp protease adaptor ClpS [Gammaproteobacteria bacterium SCGC AG-212-F23]